MAKPKVDEGAVQAEFQAIYSLVQSITSKVGPQTWQGGAAGRFAATVDGNSKSLETMMDGVWRAMQGVNKDSPPAPPPLPRTVQPLVSSGIASLSPERADSLAGALSTVASDLPGHAKKLDSLLSQGKTDASTQACRTVAAWCRSQVAAMRRRAAYARASDDVGQHPNPAFPGQSAIPDVDTFGSAQMAQLAKLQAKVFNQQFDHPDRQSPEKIAQIGADLRENLKDPYYLRSFFGAGGVKRGYIGKLPYWLHQHNHDDKGHRCVPENSVISDFATALAKLSRKRDPESQAATWNALGKAGADMPGQGLLVKYSDEKWGSHVLAVLGEASLKWRVKFPYYSAIKSYGDEATVDLIDAPRWWPSDWGIWSLKKAREYDPALNILNQINAQHDDAAARELAGAVLPPDLKVASPDKAPARTWLSRLKGDTYAALLAAPDWLDRGNAAGGVIGLATAQRVGMNRADADQAAKISADLMKSVAWWNKEGRRAASEFIGDAKIPSEFGKSKQYHVELGDGVKDGLQQVARISMPALGRANRTRSDVNIRNIDPATGLSYMPIGGDTAREFLRTFVTDKQRWAQIVSDSSTYRQSLFAQAIRSGDFDEAPRNAGLLDGTLISAKVEELENRTEISKAELEHQKQELAYLRDAVGVFIPKIPLAAKPVTSGSKGGSVAVGDVPGFTDVYTKGTDWFLSKINPADLDKSVDRARAESAHYTDTSDIDLARAIGATRMGPLGVYHGISLDQAIRKGNLSADEKSALMDWAENYTFSSHGAGGVKGSALVHAADAGTEYNGPPRE